MESLLAGFGKIAKYLTHPLALVGFALLLFFGIHHQLIESGILQPLDPEESSTVVHAFLEYGFWIALAVIVLGIGLRFVEKRRESETGSSGVRAKGDLNVPAGGGSAATVQTGDGKISIGGAPGEVAGEAQAPPVAAAPKPRDTGITTGGSVSVKATKDSAATVQTGSGSIHIQKDT